MLSVIPSIVGAFAGSYALPWLLKAAAHSPGSKDVARPVEMPGDVDRRRFLFASLAIGAAAVATGGLGRFIITRRFGVAEAARDALTIPVPTDRAPQPPAGFDTPGISPFITPNADFYRVDTALVIPRVDTDTWRLTIHGMVDHQMELTFADLIARDLIERDLTLACVSNEVGGHYVGNARWVGAPLKSLLEEAGVHADADQIVSRSVDGFTVGTPTAVAMDGRDAMLAVSMNGETLPFTHGFPVRMIVPGLYGYVSATKWLTDIELTTFGAYDPYWVQRGWAQQAPDQDRVPDRHAARVGEGEGRHRHGRRRRVGAAPRDRACRGSRGRGRVERRDPLAAGHDRHVASMAMAVGGHDGEPHAAGPGDRRGRRRRSRSNAAAVPGRSHRVAHGGRRRRVIVTR